MYTNRMETHRVGGEIYKGGTDICTILMHRHTHTNPTYQMSIEVVPT